MVRKLFITSTVLFSLGLALPVPILLHALDHALDSGLAHGHAEEAPGRASNDNSDHDHDFIFSSDERPAARLTGSLRTLPPGIIFVDICVVSSMSTPLAGSAIRQRTSDPPLSPAERFGFALSNKAPPA